MMTLKLYDKGSATGRKLGADKIVIGKSVLNQEPIKKFIERMKAQGYNVQTTEDGVEITGDTLDVDAHRAEMEKFASPLSDEEWLELCEKYGIRSDAE